MKPSFPNFQWTGLGTGLGKRLESAFRKALYDFKLLEGIDRVSVALSGGKDSLTLLLLLKAISGRGFAELEIHAIHVNGEFSCGAGINIEYLQGICDALQVKLHICTSTQKLETLECYSCSRERRRLIFEIAKQVNAPTIAFGHHSDDQAHTVLMNLLHKGEFAGNLPKLEMVDYGVTLIRPLIYISEKEIIEFAKQQGFLRALCRCPVGQHSMRKQVADLLNEIEHLYPHARANIARAGLVYGSTKAVREKP
jgi:tRNA 2-thiocytidine biosynthesis protein TtcA